MTATRVEGGILRHAEPVMGTVVSFDIRLGATARPEAEEAVRRACARLHEADAVFSTWNPRSPMSRIRAGELSAERAPAVVGEVLALCERARGLSGGWFDPWAMPGGVDPTGLVKGWAAERAAAELRSGGIRAALINAAGDIVTFGSPEPGAPWRVGLRDPRRPERLAGVVAVRGAIATSAQYERPGHVLDPRDGSPARGCASATVLGPDLTIADALATGLLAAGAAGLGRIAAIEGYSACTTESSGVRRVTSGFPPVGRAPAMPRSSRGS